MMSWQAAVFEVLALEAVRERRGVTTAEVFAILYRGGERSERRYRAIGWHLAGMLRRRALIEAPAGRLSRPVETTMGCVERAAERPRVGT